MTLPWVVQRESPVAQASTIPSLFLKQQSPFILLKDPKIEAIEKVDGEDCYVYLAGHQ